MCHLETESFTVDLVSNASFDCYPTKFLSFHTNFFSQKINLEREWEVTKFFYLDEATTDTQSSDYYTLEPSLYPLISDILIELNEKVQEREKYEKKQWDYTLKNYTANFLEFSQ